MKRPLDFPLTILLICMFSGCGQKSKVPSPPIVDDVYSVHYLDAGLEQFKISEASCNLYQDEDGTWEFIVSVFPGEPITRSEHGGGPKFEASAVLPADQLALVAGKVIVQKMGYDYDRHQNLSNIYLYSHNSVEDLRIEILEVSEKWIDAKLTGEAILNGGNKGSPDGKFSLRTKFKRDKKLKRSVM